MGFLSSLLGKSSAPAKPQSLLDSIVYMAGLVSAPASIDVALDQVRQVTSSLQPGQEPSVTQNQMLLKAYLQLEDYLTSREPLRTFSKEDIRQRLSPEVKNLIATYELTTNQKK